MTNSEKIRNMSDEELAEWLDKICNQNREDWDCVGCYDCLIHETHHYPKECVGCKWQFGILGWLKSKFE